MLTASKGTYDTLRLAYQKLELAGGMTRYQHWDSTEVCTKSPGRQDFSLESRITPYTQTWGRLPKLGLGLVQDFRFHVNI